MYENNNTMNYCQSSNDFAKVAELSANQIIQYNTHQQKEKKNESLFMKLARMLTR